MQGHHAEKNRFESVWTYAPYTVHKPAGFAMYGQRQQCSKSISDLAIMPSRTEGFGLTGLEALSAGLPILVSNNSGFGQAIRKLEIESSSVVCSDDPEEWGKAIRRVRQKPRKLRLEEACYLREAYDKEYNWVKQCKMLVNKMREILQKAPRRHSRLLLVDNYEPSR